MLEDRSLLSTFTVANLLDSGAHSLRWAIASASSGDTINFANGLHGTITLSREMMVTDGVTIDGPGADRLSISGNNSSRVFEIAASQSVSINGLTITDGHEVAGSGGGILIDAGATLNLDEVVVTDNQATADSMGNFGSGGGIENLGTLTVKESSFINNVASLSSVSPGSEGGAIDSSGPALTVANSTFANNQADGSPTDDGSGNGGAINTNGSTANITNSTFHDNIAVGRLVNGGAISIEGPLTAAPHGQRQYGHQQQHFHGQPCRGQQRGQRLHQPKWRRVPGRRRVRWFRADDQQQHIYRQSGQRRRHGRRNSSVVAAIDAGGFVGVATGGGVCHFFSSLTVTNSTFTDNQAKGGNSAFGPGGDAAGGGVLGAGFANTSLTHVTFVGNQVVGGAGASGSPGGSGLGGGFYSGIYSTATVSHALFLDNQAKGGAGGSGAPAGDGAGGAIANGGGFGQLVVAAIGAGPDNSSLTLDHSTLVLNVAQGGAGGAGGNGGSGLGGGCYVFGGTTASIDATLVIANAALGGSPGWGGASGQGTGGGLYIDTGAIVELSTSSEVIFNLASTSHKDIFGVYTTS